MVLTCCLLGYNLLVLRYRDAFIDILILTCTPLVSFAAAPAHAPSLHAALARAGETG